MKRILIDEITVKNSLMNLESAIDQLQKLKSLIERNYSIVTDGHVDQTKRIEAGISLKGNLLLYESYARPLSGYLAQFYQADVASIESQKPTVTFGLDGDWIAHELSRFTGSLNYLHNVFVLKDKLREKNIQYRLERQQTRSHIYRDAKLYFYLNRHEELKISRIHMSSPGLVEFIMSNYQHGALMASLIILISRVPNYFDRLITVWSKWKNTFREHRRKDRNERLEQEINDFFIKNVLEPLNELQQHQNIESMHEVNKAITDISKNKLADPIAITNNIFHSLAMISHLYENRKFYIIDDEKKGASKKSS